MKDNRKGSPGQSNKTMNSKERFFATLVGETTDRVPVFPLLMFFAQSRHKISYRTFATNGHALAEAQINMREKFNIDAITACSDAFRVTADLGGEMVYPEDKPPYASKPLVRDKSDLLRLKKPDPAATGSRMHDRSLALREMSAALGSECLVSGWVDMPFAEACSICGVSDFMVMLIEDPALAHKILSFLTEIVIDFSLVQLEAGAHMVGAGDAAASLISNELYEEFALPYERRVCDAIHDRNGLVKLHICGNTSHLLEKMATCGADLFNVDHLVDLKEAKTVYDKHGLCYKGNLDPVGEMMNSDPETCERKALECIEAAEGSRYMLSAGCEIPAETPDEVFHAFCNAPKKPGL